MSKSPKALMKEWRDRLGLQDWQIKFEPKCPPEEMELDDAAGCTSWAEAIKCAKVQILDPKYYEEDNIIPFDFEKTLVHELLHLKLSLVSSGVDDFQERAMHQIIDDLARALVDTKREAEAKNG